MYYKDSEKSVLVVEFGANGKKPLVFLLCLDGRFHRIFRFHECDKAVAVRLVEIDEFYLKVFHVVLFNYTKITLFPRICRLLALGSSLSVNRLNGAEFGDEADEEDDGVDDVFHFSYPFGLYYKVSKSYGNEGCVAQEGQPPFRCFGAGAVRFSLVDGLNRAEFDDEGDEEGDGGEKLFHICTSLVCITKLAISLQIPHPGRYHSIFFACWRL